MARNRLAAVLLAGAFCFTGLGNHPLRAADETRVAGIGWEMRYGDTAPVPHLGGEPFLEHPPLFYGVLGGAFGLLGAHEGVARLPGAVASFLVMLLVFDLGRRFASPAAGLAAIVALVGARGFYRYSHKVLVDPLLVLFVLLGISLYARAAFGPRRAAGASGPARAAGGHRSVSALAVFGVYASASLAFYVKGFVGVVAIAGPVAVDAIVARRWAVLRSAGHLAGLPLLLAACASWPAVLYASGGEAAVREFLVQNGAYRIFPGAGTDYVGGHEHPFWYYLTKIPELLTWWLALAPAVVAWLRRGALPAGWNAGALRFLGLVFPLGALLLSIPGTKRSLYLLPFVPPLAVAVGAWIAAMLLPDPGRSGVERAVASLVGRLLQAVLGPVTALARVLDARRSRVARAAAALAGSLRDDVVAAPRGSCRAPLRLAAIVFVGSVAWNVLGYRMVQDHGRDLGPAAKGVAALASAGLAGYDLPEEMRGALPFYTGRIARNLHSEQDLARYVSAHPGDALLYASPSVLPLPASVRRSLSPIGSWDETELDYTLYEILAERE